MKKAFLIIISLFLVACAQQAQQPAGAADVTVTIKDFKFIPDTINVKVGQTIKWTNEDSAIHTVEAANKAFTSKELYQGDSFTWTADKQGAYEYICGLHPNMKGKVIVE